MALRNSEMEFQGSIKKKEAEVTQKIAIKVAGIVDTIAKKQDIDTVFERNSSGFALCQGSSRSHRPGYKFLRKSGW